MSLKMNFENYPEKKSENKITNLKGEDITEIVKNIVATADEGGYVKAGRVFELLNLQTQYGSYHFLKGSRYEYLGDDIDYKRGELTYHEDKVHKDSIPLMIEKLKKNLEKSY